MKNDLILILLTVLMVSYGAEKKSSAPAKSLRIEKNINNNWTFNYFPEEEHGKGLEAPGYNDLNWPLVIIPHTWSTFETTGDIHPFIKNNSEANDPYWWKGWGWYRKSFTVNEKYAGRKVFVEFEGVQKYCKVWLNGKYLGDHKGGYGSFDFDVTSHILPGKENILAVAVSNRKNDQYKIPPMDVPAFNVYGGIYRDVKIVLKDKLHIPMQGSASHEGGTFITTPSVSVKQAVVRIQTWVKNDYDQARTCMLNTWIMDASGKTIQVIKSKFTLNPGQLYRFDQTSKPLKNPRLWSPETPYLYKVHSEVTDGTTVTDSYDSPLGIRCFRWNYNENALYLNGKKVTISGGRYLQEYPWLGSALPGWMAETNLKEIAGAKKYNLIIASGFPSGRQMFALTDRNGFIAVEEAPVAGDQEYSAEVLEQQIREMIRRDRNHPSVMFWSMGRAADHSVSSRIALAEDTTRILTSGDPPGASVRHTYSSLNVRQLNFFPLAGKEETVIQTSRAAPAKIVLTGSHRKINADRSSVVIVSAEIVDSKGVRVAEPLNTLKWEVMGPARLAGPSSFESERNRYRSAEGAVYSGMPVSNVIRSNGKTGRAKIIVAASGLASGSFEIDFTAVKPDNSVISEPVPLNEDGRKTVARAVLVIERLEDIPEELKKTNSDFNPGPMDRQGHRKSVRDFIFRNNPSVDTTTVEFRALTDLFAVYLENNNGILAGSDYNFSIAYFNNCRLISGYVKATKLPPLFKETLIRYYADMIITGGSEKNAGDEMNWMNWIPSGGTVIVSQDSTVNNWPKGTLISGSDELDELITAVYPVFVNYSREARDRALIFVSKMNPYVHEETLDGMTVYRAERGKPVLIPLQKFIAQ